MISRKLGRIVSRSTLALVFAIGIGAAATLSAALADEHHGEWRAGDWHHGGDGHHGEWRDGHWGYWGWRGGAQVFIEEPYPYAYYAPPPAYYEPPPPVVYEPPPPVVYEPPPPVVYAAPPVVYAAPPVVAPSFGVFIGVGHH